MFVKKITYKSRTFDVLDVHLTSYFLRMYNSLSFSSGIKLRARKFNNLIEVNPQDSLKVVSILFGFIIYYSLGKKPSYKKLY